MSLSLLCVVSVPVLFRKKLLHKTTFLFEFERKTPPFETYYTTPLSQFRLATSHAPYHRMSVCTTFSKECHYDCHRQNVGMCGLWRNEQNSVCHSPSDWKQIPIWLFSHVRAGGSILPLGCLVSRTQATGFTLSEMLVRIVDQPLWPSSFWSPHIHNLLRDTFASV
jgi:hypothetical protein